MIDMEIEEIEAVIDSLFNPEPDEDGGLPRDMPHPKLEGEHGLDLSYLKTFTWEGSSVHPHTRLCPIDEAGVLPLIRSLDVSTSLFNSGLRLFADSIIVYHGQEKRKGDLRYYPPVVLAFWSGFETFVRHTSELMLISVKNVPPVVANFLRDEVTFVDRKGNITTRTNYKTVLERYRVLLRYGYGYKVDCGSKHWQQLEKGKRLRDYYTHLDVNDPRPISSDQIIDFMEAVLLGIIWPSAQMKRTQLLGVYSLYWVWDELRKLAEPYIEQPFFQDWPLHGPHIIYCPFEGVDSDRFPNSREERKKI